MARMVELLGEREKRVKLDIVWTDVAIRDSELYFIGAATPRVGSVVNVEGEITRIDETSARLMARKIFFNVPLTTIASATSMENLLEKLTIPTLIGEGLGDDDDFDYSNLTDEQLEELKLFESIAPGGELPC